MAKMKLIKKYGILYAVKPENGEFIGRIVNHTSGNCLENPEDEDSTLFWRVYGGHGCIVQQMDNPPNPFFVKSFAEAFLKSKLLPPGTKNVFVDGGKDSEDLFNAIPMVA